VCYGILPRMKGPSFFCFSGFVTSKSSLSSLLGVRSTCLTLLEESIHVIIGGRVSVPRSFLSEPLRRRINYFVSLPPLPPYPTTRSTERLASASRQFTIYPPRPRHDLLSHVSVHRRGLRCSRAIVTTHRHGHLPLLRRFRLDITR
jgi:hypothetical protein